MDDNQSNQFINYFLGRNLLHTFLWWNHVEPVYYTNNLSSRRNRCISIECLLDIDDRSTVEWWVLEQDQSYHHIRSTVQSLGDSFYKWSDVESKLCRHLGYIDFPATKYPLVHYLLPIFRENLSEPEFWTHWKLGDALNVLCYLVLFNFQLYNEL